MGKQKRSKVLPKNKRDLMNNVKQAFGGINNENGQSEERGYIVKPSTDTVISKIKSEETMPSQSPSKTYKKTEEEGSRRPALNFTELCAFRDIIEHIYEDMELPTVRKILAIARKELNFEGSRARVRGILRNKLGFKFNKRYPNNNLVLERHSIKLSRVIYLRNIIKNDSSENKKPVVYVGELKINILPRKLDQKGILFHAGNENGFIKGADLFFGYKYRKEKPNAKDFLEYLQDVLLPKLPKESIVVMNHSTRHNMQIDAIPTVLSTKQEIMKWMDNHNIPYEEHWVKAQMLVKIKNTHPVKKFAVDELLKTHGHTVLRIPPLNTDLNPLEYIWVKLKERVSEETDGSICDRVRKAIELITEDDWKEEIGRVKKIEGRYWLREAVKEDDYEELECRVGLQSDSDSDSDTDYDYSYSSLTSTEESDYNSEADWTDIECSE